jgi:hypothetical protein
VAGTGREWWIDDTGRNTLRGVAGDTNNPPILPDEFILDFLRTIPEARESFNRLYPTMLPAEQERLDPIAASARFLQPDIKAVDDGFQARQNTAGIHTTGPQGGTRVGGNRGYNGS